MWMSVCAHERHVCLCWAPLMDGSRQLTLAPPGNLLFRLLSYCRCAGVQSNPFCFWLSVISASPNSDLKLVWHVLHSLNHLLVPCLFGVCAWVCGCVFVPTCSCMSACVYMYVWRPKVSWVLFPLPYFLRQGLTEPRPHWLPTVLVRVYCYEETLWLRQLLQRQTFSWGWITVLEVQSVIVGRMASSRQTWCWRSHEFYILILRLPVGDYSLTLGSTWMCITSKPSNTKVNSKAASVRTVHSPGPQLCTAPRAFRSSLDCLDRLQCHIVFF